MNQNPIVKMVRLENNPKRPMYYYRHNGKDSVFHVEKRIGSDSIRGTVYKVCNGKKCSALKLLSVPVDWENIRKCPTQRIEREIRFLSWCNKLLDAGVTNNLPRTLQFYNSSGSSCFPLPTNKIDYNAKCLMFQAPLADGDVNQWVTTPKSKQQVYSCVLQVLLGIYVFRTQLNAYHKDLHCGNVLYYKEKPKTYYYKFQGKTIAVPNHGFRFSLWDFDNSISFDMCKGYYKNKNDPKLQFYLLNRGESLLTEMTDYQRFLGVLSQILPDYRIGDILADLEEYATSKKWNIEELIKFVVKQNIGGKYTKAPFGAKVYNLDKKINFIR